MKLGSCLIWILLFCLFSAFHFGPAYAGNTPSGESKSKKGEGGKEEVPLTSTQKYLSCNIESEIRPIKGQLGALVGKTPLKKYKKKTRVVSISDLHSLYHFLPVIIKEYQLKSKDEYGSEMRLEVDPSTSSLLNKAAELFVPGDILIISGDFTDRGMKKEYDHFIGFLNKLNDLKKYKHIVIVAGNHERSLDSDFASVAGKDVEDLTDYFIESLPRNAHYLKDDFIVLEGKKIYGSPWVSPCGKWGHCRSRDFRATAWGSIPDDTDILVTHMPPHGINDQVDKNDFEWNPRSAGCTSLLEQFSSLRLRPALHVFGHIHDDYGATFNHRSRTMFLNASLCNWNTDIRNLPLVYDL